MVTVLFNIGNGTDSVDIVSDLLDVEKMKARPGYPYADPRYLTLSDCVYDPEPFSGKRYVLDKRSGNFI
jgi:tRNA pseudouridine38/39 synthase